MTAMPPVKAYAKTIAAADEARLVKEHLDLVKRIAWHLAARLPSSVDVDDLVQAGVIGLIEAARHYCGDRGASFETYAGIRIRGAMVDELRRGDWAPRSVHRRMRDVSAAIRAIEQDSGREARDAARERVKEGLGGLDFVSREEFDTVKLMAAEWSTSGDKSSEAASNEKAKAEAENEVFGPGRRMG